MTRQPKLSFAILLILITIVISVVTASSNTPAANGNSPSSQLTYGCLKLGPAVLCDPMTNKFNSITVTGHVERVSTINLTQFDPVEGVFGNALGIHGYRQQYLNIPNRIDINPPVFAISFWVKQDPAYLANSTVISHVNSTKSAGWIVESYAKYSQSYIQFSVTNSDSKTFSVTSPIEPGVFQNVVGVFDGKLVKIYVSGFLVDSVPFVGDYDPDPNVPLNIGVNAYDYRRPWNGAIDEVRLYNRAISDSTIQELADYSNYSQLSDSSPNDDGLVAYWPFDEGPQDKSANSNDGKLILPAVSMVFSPDNRLFFSVMDAGEIRIMNQGFTPVEEPFVRLQDASTNTSQQILGITLDPDFATNHYVYAYVTARDSNTGNSLNRVVRFTESENQATDQKVLIDNIPAAAKGRQFGGALAFRPDEKLYVATGYTNQIEPGQDANLTGNVLRINRDGTIPPDNPVPSSPVYTLGHRNMLGIAFDDKAMAIVAENGASHHDEINVLERGGDYGYPAIQQQESSAGTKLIQTDNSSAIKAARTYYKIITPTQVVFYDHNRFRTLKGMFLVASYGEGSIYGLSINETGSLVEEVAIRLPEVRGHIVSIAKAPDGEIYIAGENMYKLISIDDKRPALTYFIETVRNNNNIQINEMSLDLSNKVLFMDISNTNTSTNFNDNNGNATAASPSIQLTVPKALLGSISEVSSENYNKTSNPEDKTVEDFKTKETRRITNVGDTIIDIQLNGNFATDTILIKGQTSTLVQPPSRGIQIQR